MRRDRDGDFQMIDDLEDMMEMRRARFFRPRARRFEMLNERMRMEDGLEEEMMFVMEQPLMQAQQLEQPRAR